MLLVGKWRARGAGAGGRGAQRRSPGRISLLAAVAQPDGSALVSAGDGTIYRLDGRYLERRSAFGGASAGDVAERRRHRAWGRLRRPWAAADARRRVGAVRHRRRRVAVGAVGPERRRLLGRGRAAASWRTSMARPGAWSAPSARTRTWSAPSAAMRTVGWPSWPTASSVCARRGPGGICPQLGRLSPRPGRDFLDGQLLAWDYRQVCRWDGAAWIRGGNTLRDAQSAPRSGKTPCCWPPPGTSLVRLAAAQLETLLPALGRISDLETTPDGTVILTTENWILRETTTGWRIEVRLDDHSSYDSRPAPRALRRTVPSWPSPARCTAKRRPAGRL